LAGTNDQSRAMIGAMISAYKAQIG
jgi:hypothetical protein